MKPSAMFDLPIRHKPWRLSHLRWVMQDLAGVGRQPEMDHRTHLRATLEWVCRAQDACHKTDGGLVAAGCSFEFGWLPASKDATGWLIETLLPAAQYLDWPNLADRALVMLDVLLAQPDQGAAGRIHGLVAGYVQLGHADSLARAVSSAHLLAVMPLTSPLQQARAAHALAAAGTVSGDTALLAASRRFLQATLAQQTPCGWFPESELPVTTSVLSGILRSLIESFRLLDDAGALRAANRIADILCSQLQSDGRLAGAFDDGWMPAASHVCVTGLAQLAGCWLRFGQVAQNDGWREPAWRALAWIKRNQRTTGNDLALRDAVPNAVPIWGGSNAFGIDTLNAKYFADALMVDMVGIAIPAEAHERNR
jgi:hypothetical protein